MGIMMTVITETFEGLPNNSPVGNFYPGVSFSGNVFAITSGGFIPSQAPSPDTIAYVGTGNEFTISIPGGFTGGIDLFIADHQTPANLKIFSGINSTGSLLFSQPVSSTFNSFPFGSSDWVHDFANFAGTGKSVEVVGVNADSLSGNFAIDNFSYTIADKTPVAIPEPMSSGADLAVGAAGLGLALVAGKIFMPLYNRLAKRPGPQPSVMQSHTPDVA